MHANSPRDALSRLETMVLMAGIELPERAIREQSGAPAVDLISIHQSWLKDGTWRITHITEVDGMEGDLVTLQDVFAFDFRAGVDANGTYRGTLRGTGLRPRFAERVWPTAASALPPEIFRFQERRSMIRRTYAPIAAKC